MKVEVNGKTYCVETLIADNERLRQDVIASADTIRLVLDKIKAEIEEERVGYPPSADEYKTINKVLQIINRYRNEVGE